jgi:hypothetical protein
MNRNILPEAAHSTRISGCFAFKPERFPPVGKLKFLFHQPVKARTLATICAFKAVRMALALACLAADADLC